MIKKSIILIILIMLIIFLIILYSMFIFKKNKSENFYESDHNIYDIDNEDDNKIKYTKHNYIHKNRTRRPKQYYEKF